MIDYVTGQLVTTEAMAVVLEVVGALGMRVECTPATVAAVKASANVATVKASANVATKVGAHEPTVKLFVQLIPTADSVPRLVGFETAEERAMFRLLTSVSGIGTTTALRIMCAKPYRQLAGSIAAGDEDGIKTRGVGPKIAARLVLELKDKVGMIATDVVAKGPGAQATLAFADAYLALVALELKPADAKKWLEHEAVKALVSPTADQIVREVLLRL